MINAPRKSDLSKFVIRSCKFSCSGWGFGICSTIASSNGITVSVNFVWSVVMNPNLEDPYKIGNSS